MKAGPAMRHLAIACVASMTVACGASAPARFYTLAASAVSGTESPTRCAVLVGPVSVPPAVDRPQFVVQVAENRVEIDEFNRWIAPVNDAIARAVAGNLSILLGTPDVAVAPLASFDPTYRVSIDVQRFDSVRGRSATIDAVWTVRATATARAQSGRTFARENVQGDGYDALAVSHSKALAKVSEDIEAAIRALAKAQR